MSSSVVVVVQIFFGLRSLLAIDLFSLFLSFFLPDLNVSHDVVPIL